MRGGFTPTSIQRVNNRSPAKFIPNGMQQAVSAPRFSATSSAIDVSNRIPRDTTLPLEQAGYEVRRSPQSFALSLVHGIQIRDGKMNGGADPGGDGMAMMVETG